MLTIKLFNNQTGEFQQTALTPEINPQSECIIGRAASCHLVLASPEVSRVHGRINYQKGSYFFTDLGSTDGSRVNNEEAEVNRSYLLNEDDIIRIGNYVLLIETIEKPSLAEDLLETDRPHSWATGDLTVRCVRITDESADVKTFSFVAESPLMFHYKPGQFVTLELEIHGEPVYRSYSISSSPSRPHLLEITVKRVPAPSDLPNVPAGLVSNWLHDHLHVGDTIKISEPRGKFTCVPDPTHKLLLISAGSGITPMMSMTRWMADLGSDRDIVFFHSARTPRDLIFRQELEWMAARLPHFRLAVTTTRPEPGHAWMGFTGRLTEAMLRQIAPDFQERTVYTCGPDPFMQSVKNLLEQLAFPMQRYYEESFGAPKKVQKQEHSPISLPSTSVLSSPQPDVPALLPFAPSASPLVVFNQSGQEVACDGEASILEVAEQEGIKIRSGCKQGVCGACKKRKLEGEVRYETEPDALDAAEQAAGYILTCVACPVGRVVMEA